MLIPTKLMLGDQIIPTDTDALNAILIVDVLDSRNRQVGVHTVDGSGSKFLSFDDVEAHYCYVGAPQRHR